MRFFKGKDVGILIFRLSLGFLMFLHGFHKLTHGIEGIIDMLSSKGIPGFLAYGVYIGELIAPFLLIIGYKTRLGALLLLLNMLVVVFVAKPGDIFELTSHGGWALELAGLFLFGALGLLFTGGGHYSLSRNSSWD